MFKKIKYLLVSLTIIFTFWPTNARVTDDDILVSVKNPAYRLKEEASYLSPMLGSLEKNHALTFLNMDMIGIKDELIEKIKEALERNKRLTQEKERQARSTAP